MSEIKFTVGDELIEKMTKEKLDRMMQEDPSRIVESLPEGAEQPPDGLRVVRRLDVRARDCPIGADPVTGRAGDVRTVRFVTQSLFRPEKLILIENDRGLFVRVVRRVFGFLLALARWQLPQPMWTGNMVTNMRIERTDGTVEPVAPAELNAATMFYAPSVLGNEIQVRVLRPGDAFAFDVRYARHSITHATTFGKAVP